MIVVFSFMSPFLYYCHMSIAKNLPFIIIRQPLLIVFLATIAFTTQAQTDRTNSQLFQGLLQTGYQFSVFADPDRLGPTISAGLIFDEQVVYKLSYVPGSHIPNNQEHSIDVLLSKYMSPRQWAIGAAYFRTPDFKDIIVPALSYYNFRVRGSNFGYNLKLGLSLHALGYGVPLPIGQVNLTYRIGRK
jgi:hypothetical protein